MKPLKFKGIEISDGAKYGSDPELDKLVDSLDLDDRMKAVNEGYGYDKLINDSNKKVRDAVLATGYRITDSVDETLEDFVENKNVSDIAVLVGLNEYLSTDDKLSFPEHLTNIWELDDEDSSTLQDFAHNNSIAEADIYKEWSQYTTPDKVEDFKEYLTRTYDLDVKE